MQHQFDSQDDSNSIELRNILGQQRFATSSDLSNQCNSAYDSADSFGYHKGSQKADSTMTPNHSSNSNFKQEISFTSQDRDFHYEERLLDDDILVYRKIEKKEVQFKTEKLDTGFVRLMSQALFKFVSNPSEVSFMLFLQHINQYEEPHPFRKAEQIRIQTQINQKPQLSSVLEDVFYRNKYEFFVFSFDFYLCHLSFVSCMLFYWLKIDKIVGKDNNIEKIKNKLYKSHVLTVLKAYIEERAQQINHYQTILIVLCYFLDYLKQEELCRITDILFTQKKLLTSIKLFRKVKRKEQEFINTSNKVVFQSQMRKYQHQNKLTNSLEHTHLILTLINLHNFSSAPLLKFYRLNGFEKSREEYQQKKDTFCMWVIEIILRICNRNNNQALYKAANYIVTFMSILKKFKENKNLQGLSYLVPVIQNLKVLLPKVWRHALNRRPQIESKLQDYSQILIQKQFEREELQCSNCPIIWQQTIYELIDKFKTGLNREDIDLVSHQQFYKIFLKKLFYYRRKAQEQYQRQLELYNRDREIGISFNMYLLDSYLSSLYKGIDMRKEWKQLTEKCRNVDQRMSLSIYAQFIDHYFIGSQVRYKRVDL